VFDDLLQYLTPCILDISYI